jgi:hypothetical protein
VTCYVHSIAFYDAETWTIRQADQKYVESLECVAGWRPAGRIVWEIKYYTELSRGIPYIQIQYQRGRGGEANLTGLVTSCV